MALQLTTLFTLSILFLINGNLKHSFPSPIPHIQTFHVIINTKKLNESDKVSNMNYIGIYRAHMEITSMTL